MSREKSVRQRLGQMFLVGFDGLTVDEYPETVRMLTEDRPGGLLLFDRSLDRRPRNILHPDQLRRLCAGLQSRAATPLCIAIDQEGGRVCRLKEQDGFGPTMTAAELGERDDTAATGAAAERTAAELASLGINWNLAPVVDLSRNPDNPVIARLGRGFGADPALVVRHAAACIAAHHRHGIACCLKHFPGHGSSSKDSHLGFVDVTAGWRREELLPFSELTALGLADAIMSAHIVNRDLDPALPASLSPALLTGLLRHELGYEGLIVSDDLQMRAISERWRLDEAIELAVRAGADMLIIGNQLAREPQPVRLGIDTILRLLRQGLVTEERLEQSLTRIQRLKTSPGGSTPWNERPPTA